MKQAINITLKNVPKIQNLRKKYDPWYLKFKPHISLVYPFKDINQKKLDKHIKNSLRGIKPFKIILSGFKKSARDYYLYVLISADKNNILNLHKKLNSDLLKGIKNKDMPKYIPHITVGIFKNQKDINKAIKSLKGDDIKTKVKVSEISLLTLYENNKLKSIKNFKLE